MAVEDLTGTKYLNSLIRTNPDGDTDSMSAMDDQLRGMKNVILNTFPNLNGAVNCTPAQLNLLEGKTSIATLGANTFTANQVVRLGSPTINFENSGTAGTYNGIINFKEDTAIFAQIFASYDGNNLNIQKLNAASNGVAAQLVLTENGVVNVTVGQLQQGGQNVALEVTSRFSAKPTTNSSLTSRTAQFNSGTFAITEEWDPQARFDPATGRFTPNVAGFYRVTVNLRGYGLTAGQTPTGYLYKNGGVYILDAVAITPALSASAKIAVDVYLNGTTDYISCSLDSGGSTNWTLAADSRFQAHYIVQ